MKRVSIGWVVVSLVAIVLSVGTSTAVAQQAATIQDVILLSQRGLADETILLFLDYRELAFSLGSEEILRLREAGVSEAVIRYLIERSGAPAEVAPEVASDSYPPRYYAAYFGSGLDFDIGASSYPFWWWNDYYYLHFSPWYSFSRGHHGYAGHHYGGAYGDHGGHGTLGRYVSHATYGRQRVSSFSGHRVSGGGHTGAGDPVSIHGRANGSQHGSGPVAGRSHAGSSGNARHSVENSGGRSRLGRSSRGHSRGNHSVGGRSSRGHSHGSSFGAGHSRGGHSSGGHSGGGHSGGGHSGGGHSGGGHG